MKINNTYPNLGVDNKISNSCTFFRRLLFFFIGIYTVFQFQINLFRLAGSDFFSIVPLYFLYIIFILSFFVFISERMRVDSGFNFLIFYSAFLVYGLMLGVYNNGEDAIYGLRYFLLPFLAFVLISKPNLFMKYIVMNYYLWVTVLFFHVLGYLYYVLFLKGSVYPGIGVPSLAFSFFYFFFLKKVIFALLSMILIFMEAKRSILLSVLIVISFVYIARSSSSRKAFHIFLSFFSIVILMYFLSTVDNISVVNRINMINPFSSSFDIMMGSSGRMGELYSYFGSKDLMTILFGSGFGFSYVWDLGYESMQNEQIKGYFHLSYANYIAIAGIIGVFLSLFLFRSFFLVKNNWPNSDILRSFVLFSLVQACFGFNLSGDILTWGFIMIPFAYRYFLNKIKYS